MYLLPMRSSTFYLLDGGKLTSYPKYTDVVCVLMSRNMVTTITDVELTPNLFRHTATAVLQLDRGYELGIMFERTWLLGMILMYRNRRVTQLEEKMRACNFADIGQIVAR